MVVSLVGGEGLRSEPLRRLGLPARAAREESRGEGCVAFGCRAVQQREALVEPALLDAAHGTGAAIEKREKLAHRTGESELEGIHEGGVEGLRWGRGGGGDLEWRD